MSILFAAVPAPGHLNPLLAIARLARARGDEAAVVTGRALAPHVEAAGLRFIPFPPGGDFDYRTLADDPGRAGPAPGPEQVRRAFERVFVDTMPAQADALRRAVAAEAPDLVVVDSMFLGAVPLLLGPEPRPPVVACGVTILTLDRADGAPMGLGLPPARDAAERGATARSGRGWRRPSRFPSRPTPTPCWPAWACRRSARRCCTPARSTATPSWREP